MARKSVIEPYIVVNAVDMSSAITSTPTNVMYQDNLCYIQKWSGYSGAAGSVAIEATNDDLENTAVSPVWTELDFGLPISIVTTTGDDIININQLPFKWIRWRFTPGAGATGTMTVTVSSKQVGG